MKRKRWMGVLAAAAVLAAAGLCWWAAGRGDPQPLLPEREDLPQEVTVTRFDPFVDHTEEKVLTDPAAIGRAVEALSTGRCDQGRRSPEDLGGGTSLDIVLTYGDGSRWTLSMIHDNSESIHVRVNGGALCRGTWPGAAEFWDSLEAPAAG